mmetsp:Transcript_29935/g.31086  ORF Transcript_29935/g.31086 Transcript_29935/m.31086 type:complete len:431 (+) Transcript_29935:29-1321(+)|eukprot:CAMPEP_0170524110 /NCGR_PEP_ID=MMETSP0209-20121228/9513_1 /TAXON_ID=665100 ORGANISM="Litonotus pictus, Strain P1" /NCGR_SAMPLE_ID=MMETSP0209 /ASSEMBLY_ACC=CAM_ASM_000301 /LENGTH=430 /DNA_ID=CAMNT_0010812585 /DNA_START=11 /DNA_END=1303 /DNA_ORIENTATION=+
MNSNYSTAKPYPSTDRNQDTADEYTSKPDTEVFRNRKYLRFTGSQYFRFKLAYSLLTTTPIEVSDINTEEVNIGIKPYELSFLRLITEITNGSHFKINETGTQLKFIPGTITNNMGEFFSFDCDCSRAISYYLEGLFPICIFGKDKLNCTLKGSTHNNTDLSIDCFKAGIESIMNRIVAGHEGNKLDIVSRAFGTNKGEVKAVFPIIKFIEAFDWVNIGKIKKVGGHCYTNNCSHLSNKLIDQLRINFNKLLNDVWIGKNTHTEKGGKPGFGISVWATTTEGFTFCYDKSCFGSESVDPEELSNEVCEKILDEVLHTGSVDTHFQSLIFFLMSMTQRTAVSKLKVTRLSDHAKGLLKIILELFGVKFKIDKVELDDYEDDIEDEEEEDEDEDSENSEESKENKQELAEPNFYLVFSCVGYQMDNKYRVEG